MTPFLELSQPCPKTSVPPTVMTIDGVSNLVSGKTASLKSNLLTTLYTNDIIIVIAGAGSSTETVTSVSDTAGLTWAVLPGTIRYTDSSLGVTGSAFEFWYAVASNPLTNDVITVTWNTVTSSGNGFVAFGVSGSKTASPLDVVASNTGTGTSPTATITTTDPNDMVLLFCDNSKGTASSPAQGFKLVFQEAQPYLSVEWTTVTVTGTYTPSLTLAASATWLAIAFAIKSA